MTTAHALVRASTAPAEHADCGFDFSDFRIFRRVPEDRDFGIASLNGMVVVYDERPLHVEGIIHGSYYIRQSQRPRGNMAWDTWLRREWDDRRPRVGPAGPLSVHQEVVQAIRWPDDKSWSVRLPGGHVDGPYHDWAFGIDLIGKVVGVYLPSPLAEEPSA